jgi:hypothetical protein
MEITFYVNNEEPEKVNKNLGTGQTFEGTLKDRVIIERPSILIETDIDINDYNYFYIPEFNRYYFRTDIEIVRNNLFRISGRTDVLMSFKEPMKNFQVILDHSEVTGVTNYQSSPVWQALVKTKTDIINFPYGLSENGEFILITAGG